MMTSEKRTSTEFEIADLSAVLCLVTVAVTTETGVLFPWMLVYVAWGIGLAVGRHEASFVPRKGALLARAVAVAIATPVAGHYWIELWTEGREYFPAPFQAYLAWGALGLTIITVWLRRRQAKDRAS